MRDLLAARCWGSRIVVAIVKHATPLVRILADVARVGGESLAQEVIEDQANFPPAADHADKCGPGLDQCEERLFIVLMPPGDDDTERIFIDVQSPYRGFDRAGDELLSPGKSFGIAISHAIVDDPDV